MDRQLLKGSGTLAVMKLLSEREMYGYELVEQLEQRTDNVLGMGQSTLYPMLYTLETKGLVNARVEQKEGSRRRKYYSLTAAGRKRLDQLTKEWGDLTGALALLGVRCAAA